MQQVKRLIINVNNWCHFVEICGSMNSTRKWPNGWHRCHGSHSGVSGGTSRRSMVKNDEGHPVCANSLPAFSADLHKHHFTAQWETHLKPRQHERENRSDKNERNTTIQYKFPKSWTLLKQTSQRTYMEGLFAPARKWRVGLGVVRYCVHVNVHLHLIVQDLHELLHGGQVTRLQLWPHWHIYRKTKFTALGILDLFNSLFISFDLTLSCNKQQFTTTKKEEK